MIGIQGNCTNFNSMLNETAILLQEKMASLQGNIRQLQDDKIELHAQIDLLKKEKDILIKALNHFTAIEGQAEILQNKNIMLESQLSSLLGAIEKIERDSK